MNIKKKGSSIFGGIILGIIFIIAGTILLWWNEGNNVRNIKTTNEVEKELITIDSSSVDRDNEGKLVLTTGTMNVEGSALRDSQFNVSTSSAVLNRVVEMYQWQETKETNDDKTVYTYDKVWNSSVINSKDFNNSSSYTNPTRIPYESSKTYASLVKVGAFKLSEEQLNLLPTSTTVAIPSSAYIPSGYKIDGNYITNSKDLNNPEIGDVRIYFKSNDYKEVTITAVQSGDSFKTFVSSQNKKVNRIDKGILSKEEVINNMRESNKMLKWILRGVGVLLLVLGYISLLSPISKLTSFIPILGNLVGTAISGLGFLVGVLHSLVIITVAWIRFRPVIGIILLAVIVLIIVLISKIIKKGKANTAQVQTTEMPPIENTNNVYQNTANVGNDTNNNFPQQPNM